MDFVGCWQKSGISPGLSGRPEAPAGWLDWTEVMSNGAIVKWSI
jgi:hypothetical protein